MPSITFEDLGIDILESEIIPLLSPRDIRALELTSKSFHQLVSQSPFVWQELYTKTFGTKPTPFTLTKWPDLYKLRSKGRFYAWGELSGGRLALSLRDGDVPNENLITRGFAKGVARPTKVPGVDITLADVSAGGFSFQLLTDKGEIYSTANYNGGHHTGPGPDTNDYNELQSLARQQEQQLRQGNIPLPFDTQRRIGSRLSPEHQRIVENAVPFTADRTGNVITVPPINQPAHPSRQLPRAIPLPRNILAMPYVINTDSQTEDEEIKKKSGITNKFLKRETAMKSDTKFVSVSSGRAHFVGLSNTGNIWSWDRSDKGVQIGFYDEQGNDIETLSSGTGGHRVLRAIAGWDSTVAYLYNYGLVYWKKRDALKQGETKARAHFVRVPHTSDLKGCGKIIDFIVGESFLIYITEDGKIYRNDMNNEDSILLNSFQDYLKIHSNTTNPKFTRLSGSYNHFAAFSNEDLILTGSKETNEPLIIEELQHKDCINVTMGDYHYLALLRDGTLLSWGLESQSCGCLGLGRGSDSDSDSVQFINEGNGSRRVLKPSVVPISENQKVLAIASAGWQSSAIICEE